MYIEISVYICICTYLFKHLDVYVHLCSYVYPDAPRACVSTNFLGFLIQCSFFFVFVLAMGVLELCLGSLGGRHGMLEGFWGSLGGPQKFLGVLGDSLKLLEGKIQIYLRRI